MEKTIMNATQRPHGMGKLTRSRMRTLFHSAVLGIAGATISAPAANGQSARITVDRSKPMVVVISLDAFGAESLKDPFMPAPTLRMLMAKGAYARSMRPVNPTITWPNHTAMVTGVDPSRSFVMANGLIIRNHHPNLTLVHFLALDEMEHMHGFDTEEAKTTIGFLDGLVKQIVDAVQDAGDTDRTTFIIVSDHGQMTVKATVQPNAMLRQANISSSEAEVLPEAGIAYVYIRHGEGDEVAKLKKVFDGREGIRSVITPEGFAQIGFADPKVNPQSPDMVLFAQNGYSFVAGEKIALATLSAPKGTHGYPNTEPLMQEIFIAEGHGIRAAGEIAPIANVDVAPTIARLLGLKMPDVQGQAVGTILK
jgi:predicted AlkP superfamily pyrophosphatase or phosphodiesterase